MLRWFFIKEFIQLRRKVGLALAPEEGPWPKAKSLRGQAPEPEEHLCETISVSHLSGEKVARMKKQCQGGDSPHVNPS